MAGCDRTEWQTGGKFQFTAALSGGNVIRATSGYVVAAAGFFNLDIESGVLDEGALEGGPFCPA
jgi:hypothetical protein